MRYCLTILYHDLRTSHIQPVRYDVKKGRAKLPRITSDQVS
jgi:hypothetical protein